MQIEKKIETGNLRKRIEKITFAGVPKHDLP